LIPPVDVGILTVVGLVAWVLSFSTIFGPVYYFCSVKFFPPHLQATGGALMQMCTAFWMLVVSAVFPTAVTLLSGGEGGDKRWGRGLTFLVFAGIGGILSAFLSRIFKTWEEVEADDGQTSVKPTMSSHVLTH
jgi:uncharacterized Tic20 family protein